jgi:hypothetical protein
MEENVDNRTIRERLEEVFPQITDFDTFCQDDFPAVYRRFAVSMDRLIKTNLLLTCVGPRKIATALDKRSATTLDPSLRDRAFGRGDPYLYCDRGAQFSYIQGMLDKARAHQHEVILLPGGQEEAHQFFLARVEGALPREPARRIEWVRWPRRYALGSPTIPTTKNEVLGALAQSLGAKSINELKVFLAQQLDSHHLIFLHPIVDKCLDTETLAEYYGIWLPQLLIEAELAHFQFRCKFVQPIAWHPQPWWKTLFGRNSMFSSRQAIRLIRRLERLRGLPLSIEKTKDLMPITREDVRDFLAAIGYAKDLPLDARERERDGFIVEVCRPGASSEQILRRIADLLP